MSWVYVQRTGELIAPDGEVVGVGYAGNGTGKNNPAAQDQHNVGPLPAGRYRIGEPTNDHAHLGPFALPLMPANGQEMFGRDSFWIHGDALLSPGFASNGCIVMGRSIRMMVWNSHDLTLRVVAETTEVNAQRQDAETESSSRNRGSASPTTTD